MSSNTTTKYSGRLLELGGHQYSPLFHDVFKLLSVMLVIEVGQRYFLPQIYLDGVYHVMCLFFIGGVIIYHLIIDKIIGSGGPATMCCPFLGLRELAPSNNQSSTGGGGGGAEDGLGRNVVINDAPPMVGEQTKLTHPVEEPKPFGGFFG